MHQIIEDTKQVRAILVGLNTEKDDDEFDRSMNELKELTKALDIKVVGVTTQNLPSPDRSTFVGSGKVEEIKN